MAMKETSGYIPCDLCATSTKRGHLWIGGKDYVECPQCFGAGVVQFVEQIYTPYGIFAVGGHIKRA